jgi:arginine:agmatine antiporter
MFAFLGLESATVPAGDVVDPERTIPRSTLLGVGVSSLLYVLGTIVVLGVVPREQLAGSIAPFADVARLLWGSWAAWLVSIAVVVSTIGSLNGWTLLMGQVPMAAADDGLFPRFFGRRSAQGVPAVGIVASAGFASGLVLVQAAGGAGFAKIYALIIGLATLTAAIPYALCALAGTLIGLRQGNLTAMRISAVEVIAFIFSIFVIYGCGPEAVLYGLILLLLGIPVYVWQRREHVLAAAHGRPPVAMPAADRVT